MNNRILLWILLPLVLGVVLSQTLFIVDQKHEAVVTQFGEPVRLINAPGNYDPGLKAKIPFFETVTILDKRNLVIEPPQAEVTCADQNRIVVDAFVRYRISDPLKFYRTLHNEAQADDRIQPLINSSLREVLGSATFHDIIATRRAEVMALTLKDLRLRAARQNLGIEVLDVRIKHADQPPQIQQAVFQRMTANLQQQAAQTRAIGEQQKREIVAQANKDVTITLATAYQQSTADKGEGDAKRATIMGAAYGRDPSFAAFWRSMQAYQIALANGDTTMVLSPDSDFFKYFKKGPGSR